MSRDDKENVMETLEILEAHRQNLILNMWTAPNSPRTAWLLEQYEKDCRAAGIDPDTWEGLKAPVDSRI